jgi:DNA modification methylase
VHGATFPIYFPEHFINSFCPIQGSVIDLFGGSGSTLIACEKTNRKCFMMEIDPIYCDVIIARWEKFTGQKAILGDS